MNDDMFKLVACGIFVIFVGVTAHFVSTAKEPACLAQSTVQEILELKVRDAVILMSDGNIITVNQASLKIGDTYCYKYGSKWD